MRGRGPGRSQGHGHGQWRGDYQHRQEQVGLPQSGVIDQGKRRTMSERIFKTNYDAS